MDRKTRSILRRRLLISLTAGLAWSVFDFLVFFGVAEIREPTLGLLGRAMEPLLLALPAGTAGLSLLGWALTFVRRHRRPRPAHPEQEELRMEQRKE